MHASTALCYAVERTYSCVTQLRHVGGIRHDLDSKHLWKKLAHARSSALHGKHAMHCVLRHYGSIKLALYTKISLSRLQVTMVLHNLVRMGHLSQNLVLCSAKIPSLDYLIKIAYLWTRTPISQGKQSNKAIVRLGTYEGNHLPVGTR